MYYIVFREDEPLEGKTGEVIIACDPLDAGKIWAAENCPHKDKIKLKVFELGNYKALTLAQIWVNV